MPKLSLTPIESAYASKDALNANFDAIEVALENTLSRDGTAPNSMSANLDMNGNSIVNASSISTTSLTVDGSSVDALAAQAALDAASAASSASAASTSASEAAASAALVEGQKLVWRGAWSSATAYAVNDAVSYNGASFICTLAHTNHTPADDAYWDYLAEKGAAGAGTGDVVGPSSATNNSLARFDGTTGKLLKDGAVIGTDVQAYNAKLAAIAGLAVTDGNFVVGNGTTFVAESGATARTSLGLAIGTDVQAYDADIPTVAASQAEMETGTETALRSMSPLRVRQAINVVAGALPPAYLYGLKLSNNTTDSTNDIDISAGKARDASDSVNLSVGALTKRLDATWVAGTNQGGRTSSQAIANGTWHVFAMRVGGSDDVGFDTSVTGANLVADHSATHVRRIGSIVRSGGAIVQFVQADKTFRLKTPVRDLNAGSPPITAVTRTLSVPTGIKVEALVASVDSGTPPGTDGTFTAFTYLSDLDTTDSAPSMSVAPFCHSNTVANVYSTPGVVAGPSTSSVGAVPIVTNTSAQIRSRTNGTGAWASTSLQLYTYGWRDYRLLEGV